MQNFYGGPNGQSFEIKEIFTSKNGLTNSLANDLSKGWTSPISVDEFVIVSYGMPNDEKFDDYRNIDILKEGKGYNSTLWQKCYDESKGSANGLYYKLIASMTGNTPEILIEQPAGILNADKDPYVTYDNSNIDQPVMKFFLPQSQVLKLGTTQKLTPDKEPEILYDQGAEDDNSQPGVLGGTVNNPVIQFSLPVSQAIKEAIVEQKLDVGQPPVVRLDYGLNPGDTGTITNPILKFKLPVSQQLLPEKVNDITLNANQKPRVEFDDTNPNEPSLTFYLPQSQVMVQPTRTIVDPMTLPSVEDIGTVNSPQLHFKLPRAIQFYYGSLLGKREENNGIYILTNEAFSEYAVGDYYINATTGFIYRIVEKNSNECKFQYVASIQTPLPTVKVDKNPLNPYQADLTPTIPQVSMTFEDDVEKTGWILTFKMPKTPVPKASFDFVGIDEEGSVQAEIFSETEINFDFKIPRGTKMFSGLDVGVGHYDTIIEGALPGDMYLNTDPTGEGEIYVLNKFGLWEKQKGSLKGPVGDALNIVREYRINVTDTLIDNLSNGVNYIKEHYVDEEGNPIPYEPDELFAITWIDTEGKETSYWYFFTEEEKWARVQLTSGVLSFIETEYNDEADGPVENKTYSISYINQLIGGNIDSGNMDKVAFSKDQIYNLMSWGTWADAIAGDDIPEPENHDTLSAEEVIALMSWNSIASLLT